MHFVKAVEEEQEGFVCNYTTFMAGITNLEKLSGRGYFTKYLCVSIECCHHTLVFHQLKDIELNPVDFGDIRAIDVLARLIVGTPNLCKLKIHAECCAELYDELEQADELEDLHLCFRDLGCGPNFRIEKLRVVKIDNVSCLPTIPLEMEFIKFLLQRSPMLETIHLGYSSTTDEQKLTAELSGFSWASPNAKLLF